MARPRKDAVDYFPHFVNWGKTIPILESKFGNDGYACWFKILETLGKTSGHALDCNDSMEWEFLVQKLRVSEETATEIIAVLCKLGALDATLWNEKRIIWSENFVAQLEPVYSKRRVSAPEKPECGSFCDENPEVPEVSGAEMRQRRVEKSKGEKRKEKGEPAYSQIDIDLSSELQAAITKTHPEYFLNGVKKSLDKWPDVFRLIRERDNRKIEDIWAVIQGLPDHEFWRNQIFSPEALRQTTKSGADKFTKILVDMRGTKKKTESAYPEYK